MKAESKSLTRLRKNFRDLIELARTSSILVPMWDSNLSMCEAYGIAKQIQQDI